MSRRHAKRHERAEPRAAAGISQRDIRAFGTKTGEM